MQFDAKFPQKKPILPMRITNDMAQATRRVVSSPTPETKKKKTSIPSPSAHEGILSNFSRTTVTSESALFCFLRRRTTNARPPMIASRARDPTTLPAITPALLLDLASPKDDAPLVFSGDPESTVPVARGRPVRWASAEPWAVTEADAAEGFFAGPGGS